MTLVRLRTFVEVYRSGSLRQAADNLGVTQPAASNHVQSLETQLNKPLFVRHARGVNPTAIADELAASIGGHIDEALGSLDRLKSRSSDLSGTIHIVGPAEFIGERLTSVVAALDMTEMRCRIRLGNREFIQQSIIDNEADIAITSYDIESPDLVKSTLYTEQLLLVGGGGWRQGCKTLQFNRQTLLNKKWVAYDDDMPLIRTYLDTVYGAGPLPPASITADDLRIVRDLAIEGRAVTVLPDYLCAEGLASGKLHLVEKPKINVENKLLMYSRRNSPRNPSVKFLKEHLTRKLTLV